MKDNLILHTERLKLRPLTIDDVDNVFPYCSNPEIPKLMAWEPHKTKDDTREFLRRIDKNRNAGTGITWAILLNKEEFCGIFSLIAIARHHHALTYNRAELAYWLGPEFQGKGIMTEAGEAIINFAFTSLDIHRLVVSHFTENDASGNLIKRLGFKYIGEEREAFQKNGVWYNHKLYDLLESDL